MGLQQKYRGSGEGAIATYDFVDIAGGTGIIEFFAGRAEASKYVLSDNSFYSDPVLTTSSRITAETYSKELDLDFDVEFNKPVILSGVTVINVPVKVYHDDAGVWGYPVVIVKHYDGSTETTLATTTGAARAISASSGATYGMFALQVDIPLTSFKVGEILRLTVEGWAKATAPGDAIAPTISIGHDPKNRTAGWDASGDVPSILAFQVPVRLDL